MSLLNILLYNANEKTYLPMMQLRAETEMLITKNVVAANPSIAIQTIDFSFDETELTSKGWTRDDGLYERMINEYNSKPDVKELLIRWK